MEYTVNDFFCGCGGMGLGFKQAGYKTLLAWDYDKWALQSYKHNVDEIAEIKDISKVGPWDVPKADVWTFGFPCQDISIAGKQKGMIKNETRSGLFYAIMDLLEFTYDADKPKVIMAENVKNVKKYLPAIEQEYAKVGYKMYAQLYNSKYWGVPQNRERYFIVGIRDDLGIEFKHLYQVTENVPILLDILDKEIEDKYFLSDKAIKGFIRHRERHEKKGTGFKWKPRDLNGVASCLRANGALAPTDNTIIVAGTLKNSGTSQEHNNRVHDVAGVSPTATAVSGGTHHIKVVDDLNDNRVRKLTPNEYGKLQGFPMDTWEQVVSNTQAYKQFGNAVSVPVAKALAEAIIGQVLSKIGG